MILADDTNNPYYQQSPYFNGGSTGPVQDHILAVFWPMLVISIIVFVGVSGTIIYASLKFRRKDDDEEPRQIHGNNRLELGWTAVPLVTLLALFVLTAVNMKFINRQYDPVADKNAALFVCVQGQRFNWSYFYEDDCGTKRATGPDSFTYDPGATGGVVRSTKLVVPVGTPVQLQLVSADVNHSFFIPQIAGQVNAIPGQKNALWFQLSAPGVYHGACTELCGNGHYNMILEIDAMNDKDFQVWYGQKLAAAKSAASGSSSTSAQSGQSSASGTTTGDATSASSSTTSTASTSSASGASSSPQAVVIRTGDN